MVNASHGTVIKKQEPPQSEEHQYSIMTDATRPTQMRMVAFEKILNTIVIPKISGSIPQGCGITAERMVRLVLGSFRKVPKLLDCSTESIFLSIGEAATLGLQIDSTLGHAYLIPYGRECKLMPGYKGFLDLARRNEKLNIKTRCVHKGDIFEYEEGDADFIRHVPNQSGETENRDEDATHVYLIAKDMITGAIICRNVWSRARIESHKRKYSKAWTKTDNPWQTAWGSMARKTLIRDSICRGELPVSVEVQKLANREEQYEAKFIELPQVRRQTIDDISDLIDHGNGNSASAAVPEEIFDDTRVEDPGEEDQSVGASAEQQAPEEESQDLDADVPSPLHIREGESPKQWTKRIEVAIENAKNGDEMDDIMAAIDTVAASGSVGKTLITQVGNVWSKANAKFLE